MFWNTNDRIYCRSEYRVRREKIRQAFIELNGPKRLIHRLPGDEGEPLPGSELKTEDGNKSDSSV